MTTARQQPQRPASALRSGARQLPSIRNSCFPIRTICQPVARKVWFTLRSRARFGASFFRQNAALLRGFVA
jgi:hypothetical protein